MFHLRPSSGAPFEQAVNQMPFSVGSWDKSLVSDDAKRGGVVVQAYSPLASGGLPSDPDCVAIGKVGAPSPPFRITSKVFVS